MSVSFAVSRITGRAGSASFNSFKKSIPLPSGKLMSRSTNDTAPHKSCSRAVFKFRHDMTCLFSDFKARHRPWFNPVSSSITKICSIEFLQSFLDVRKNSRNIVAALLPFTIFYLRDYINQGSLEKKSLETMPPGQRFILRSPLGAEALPPRIRLCRRLFRNTPFLFAF